GVDNRRSTRSPFLPMGNTPVTGQDRPDRYVRDVRNGLTLHWSSGVVEGNVSRLKMIKRQMYGRACFPLLRKRVLLTAWRRTSPPRSTARNQISGVVDTAAFCRSSA